MSLPQEYTVQMTGLRGPGLTGEDIALAASAINSTPFDSWNTTGRKLVEATGMSASDRATVAVTDTGTHVDPVTAATVPNAGVYDYSASPAGWKRVGDLDAQSASAAATTATEAAAVAVDIVGSSDVPDQAIRVTDSNGFYVDIPIPDPDAAGTIAPGVDLATDAGAGTLVVIDELGFFVDLLESGGSDNSDADAALYGARNSSNLAYARSVRDTINTVTASFSWNYNHAMLCGQSLGAGASAWPAFSVTSVDGNVMIGNSIRCCETEGNSPYDPIGPTAFMPAVATVESLTTGTGILVPLSPAEVAALSPTDGSRGEVPITIMANAGKLMRNQRRGVLSDPDHVFVLTTVGVGGTPVERHITTPPTGVSLFPRFSSTIDGAKALVPSGKTYGVVADVWMQGEQNYSTSWAYTKAGYRSYLNQVRNEHNAYIAAHCPDQVDVYGDFVPPAFFTYQTSGSWVRDFTALADALGASTAQKEWADETPGVYLWGPTYPVTNATDGHLDANGSRWMGAQLAKVYHRVVELRQDWKPLQARSWTVSGNVLAIDYHVPEAPLVFDKPYAKTTPADYADKGFTVIDSSGVVPITAVRIVLDTIVEITLAREPLAGAYWRYGDYTYHGGNGCLRDSDPTTVPDEYVYQAGSGQTSDMNIAALVGEPYPLHNWAVLENNPI